MTEHLGTLFYIGIAISLIGLGIGFYNVFRNDTTKISIIVLFVVITIIGLIIVGIDSYQEFIQQQEQEKTIKENIENMSCSQLHDALLHNTINGTSHIQRATERYVAGCESK